MTDETRGRGVPLPNRMGQGKRPQEIVYTHYTYDESRPAGQQVSATTRSYVVRPPDIKKFVESRINRLPLPAPVQTRRRNPSDSRPDRAINTYVGAPCWVVIELDAAIDWHFEPNHPGITTDTVRSDDNCDLEHVLADGTLAGSNGPPTDDCRLIFFRVQRRQDLEHQRFLCHIIHGKKRFEDPVEPDIPNDGGRFPIPIDGEPQGEPSA